MREQEIELLNHIIDFNTMQAQGSLKKQAFEILRIEAQESLIKQTFEILQEQLGTFSLDFLENPIVNSFIRWLNDGSTICAVLEEKQTGYRKKPPTYKANQIDGLQNRLGEGQDASQQNSSTKPSDSLITTNNSNQLTVPTNRSKKRTAPSDNITFLSYITAGPTDELELSNLVKQMPPPLSGQTHFCVEQAVGLVLKNLPKTTKGELGIGFIRKLQSKTQYKVEISDLSKYRDAYNKYTAPLFVTAANTNNPLSSQNQSTDVQSFSPQEEQRNNSENQPLINAAAEISHVPTAFIQTNELDASENQPLINTVAEISHVPTAFIQTNELDAMEQKIKDMDDLINNFKSALCNQKSSVINDMWNKNPLLGTV